MRKTKIICTLGPAVDDKEMLKRLILEGIPFVDKIGYVANSPNTVAKGTISAGHLYDHIGDIAYVQVLFVTTSKVICILLTQDEVEVEKESNQSPTSKEDPTGKVDIKNRMNKPQYPIGFHL